ncbi:MAG: hypothetical protein KJO76_02790 [Gammaproteobacteria bacterium]|nr:hypothetical protein [Gammaproteobacteria bacterium]
MTRHISSGLRPALFLVIGALTMALPGCAEPPAPEEEIRTLIAEAETAVEARDLGDIRPLIAEAYIDPRGNGKPAIERLLRFMFIKYQSVHLQIYVESIDFPQPGVANVIALVGMADTAGALPDVDLYQFDVRLLRNDDEEWQVVEADWRRGLGKAPER